MYTCEVTKAWSFAHTSLMSIIVYSNTPCLSSDILSDKYSADHRDVI